MPVGISKLSDVQKEVIHLLVDEHLTPKKVAIRRKKSFQAIYKTIERLEKKGILKHLDVGVYEHQDSIQPIQSLGSMEGSDIQPLSSEGEGLNGSPKAAESTVNLHALQLDIPILSGSLDLVKDFGGYFTEGMRGWKPQFKRVIAPLGFTIRNNNNKSVSIFVFSREIPKSYDITTLAISVVNYVCWLLREKGVMADCFSAETKTLHLCVRNEDLDRVFNKGERFEVLLNRPAQKIFENEKEREARAWVDSSPYRGTETNDIRYKENLIMMPERVERIGTTLAALDARLAPAIETLSQEMNTHVRVMNRIDGGIDRLDKGIQKFNKTVGRLNERLSQKRLDEF